jgi:hypothetical protein
MSLDARRLPGPMFATRPLSEQSKLWSLRRKIKNERGNPYEYLLEATHRLPTSVVDALREVLEDGLERTREEAIRISAELSDEWGTPAAAFWAVAWLEAAEEALTQGAHPQHLSVLAALAPTQDEHATTNGES